MGFKFSLQRLLRTREHVEKQRWRELQAASNRLISARENLRLFHEWNENEKLLRAGRMNSPDLRAAEIHFWRDCDQVSAQQEKILLQSVAQLEGDYQIAFHRFHQARCSREVISELRQRAYESYRSEVQKKEQLEADETFIMRYRQQEPFAH